MPPVAPSLFFQLLSNWPVLIFSTSVHKQQWSAESAPCEILKIFGHCLFVALNLPAKNLVIFLEECSRVNVEADTFLQGKEGEQGETFHRVKKAGGGGDQTGQSFDGGRSHISGHWSCEKSGDRGGEKGEGGADERGEGGVGEKG